MLRWLIVLLISGFFVGTSSAFQVQPLRYYLEPIGGNAQITLVLENTYPTELPVEVEVLKRTIGSDGIETRESAEDDFIVFPPQSLVAAGEEQAFRVRYIGEPEIDEMQGYIVMFRQLPVRSLDSQESGVEIVFALGTAAYVAPSGTSANLVSSVTIDTEDATKLNVELQNSGRAFGYANMFTLNVGFESGEVFTIPYQDYAEGDFSPLVMPNSTRKFQSALPDEFVGQEISSVNLVPREQ